MLSNLAKKLAADSTGATAVEYGLIVALIVIAMFAAFQGTADATLDMWDKVERETVDAMT